jgi:hypothetical protein
MFAVTDSMVGASGTLPAYIVFEAADVGLEPYAFTAVTVKV